MALILRTLYGEDYEKNLGSGCINYTKEANDKNFRLVQRGIAFALLSTNLLLGLTLYPVWDLVAYFTNWCMMFSLLSVLMITFCGSLTDIHLHKNKLACLHILFEFAFMMNLVTVLVYWGMIHNKLIDNFEGL